MHFTSGWHVVPHFMNDGLRCHWRAFGCRTSESVWTFHERRKDLRVNMQAASSLAQPQADLASRSQRLREYMGGTCGVASLCQQLVSQHPETKAVPGAFA
jgi:hypothetical protein